MNQTYALLETTQNTQICPHWHYTVETSNQKNLEVGTCSKLWPSMLVERAHMQRKTIMQFLISKALVLCRISHTFHTFVTRKNYEILRISIMRVHINAQHKLN